MNYRSLAAVTVLLLMAMLPGCGRKTALVPPQNLVPVSINDLRYTLNEQGVTLEWSYPTKLENGDELQGIESFEIQRAVIPEEEFCQGCPVQYEEPVVIEGGRLPGPDEARTAVYTEEFLQSGYRYLYKVRSRAGWWYASRDSNTVSFSWWTPPAVPGGVSIVAGDKKLTLHWTPVTENINGDKLVSPPLYQVYRKSGNSQFSSLGQPLQEAGFIDTGLKNGRTYFYQVRTLIKSADTLQAGGASQMVSGVPSDLTPPPQPRNLVAISTPAGVKLVWQAVAGDDLAGYKVYRRAASSQKPDLIAEVPLDQNQYIDRDLKGTGRWFYSVTSFDKAEPVNESLPAMAAGILVK